MLVALASVALLLATVPATMTAVNLLFYREPRPPRDCGRGCPAVSVLIPARDEGASIGAALEAVLASRDVDLEVVVMDDHSTDATAEIVRRYADRDPRVRLAQAPPLPAGWGGKPHACQQLAGLACNPILVFLDADVRVAPRALRACADEIARTGAALISGVPRQRTETWAERLVVPLIHFVLLGFLPMPGVRWTSHPAFAAGCGQLFVARRDAYRRAGGHAAVRSSRHDGLTLPRAFRRAGLATDLFDATRLATCRMYANAAAVWRGFAKNATEGMASPVAIVPWTVLLFGGQVLPFLLVAWGALAAPGAAWLLPAAAAALLAAGTRGLLALRFRQSVVGALLHPVGVLIVLAIQWYAWFAERSGRVVPWKGRLGVES